MADASNCRVVFYICTISLHISNIIYMAISVRHLKEDLELKIFLNLQPRFFTCWNFGLQVIYAGIALFCDFLLLRNSSNKAYKLNKHLRSLRDILFAAIVFPCSMLVFSVFWSLYILNRDLIYPDFIDRALTPLSNHIMHTLIVPIVLLELVLRPRIPPKSHRRNLFHLLVHLAVYLSILAYTYKETGIWIYPIFDKLYGTVYFPIAMLIILSITVAFYYLQWALTDFIWGTKSSSKKINDLRR